MTMLQADLRKATDQVLLQAALSRDPQAWNELWRRFRPLIFRCILGVCKRYGALVSNEDINEIFGDVCVNLLRDDMHKLRAYDPTRGARLSSWLGLLSINAAHDFLRQTTRRPVLLRLVAQPDHRGDPLEEQPDEAPSALEQLLAQERAGQLSALLAGFSLRDRRFIDLYFRGGLSPEEVAAAMGISIKTVYSKKNKVRVRLLQLAQKRRERLAESDYAVAA